MATKKSAFDVLMNKSNKIDKKSKSVKKNELNDSDIIVLANDTNQLDENNKKPESTLKKRSQVFSSLKIQHIHQYTGLLNKFFLLNN